MSKSLEYKYPLANVDIVSNISNGKDENVEIYKIRDSYDGGACVL